MAFWRFLGGVQAVSAQLSGGATQGVQVFISSMMNIRNFCACRVSLLNTSGARLDMSSRYSTLYLCGSASAHIALLALTMLAPVEPVSAELHGVEVSSRLVHRLVQLQRADNHQLDEGDVCDIGERTRGRVCGGSLLAELERRPYDWSSAESLPRDEQMHREMEGLMFSFLMPVERCIGGVDCAPGFVFITSNVSGSGAFDKSHIDRREEQLRDDIRSCYADSSYSRRDGEADIRFIITRSGAVSRVRIKQSNIRNAAFKRCLTRKIRRWTFPAFVKRRVRVDYRFEFTTCC